MKRLWIPLLLALALSLAGCSSSDDAPDGAADTTPVTISESALADPDLDWGLDDATGYAITDTTEAWVFPDGEVKVISQDCDNVTDQDVRALPGVSADSAHACY